MVDGNEWPRMALRLEELAGTLVDAHAVDDTLDGVLKLAVDMAPCDVVSVSLRHGKGRLETTAASDPVAERAHHIQQEMDEGPCLDVEWGVDGVNVVPDTRDSRRWPRWGEQAAQLGLSSLLAVRARRTAFRSPLRRSRTASSTVVTSRPWAWRSLRRAQPTA